MFSRPVPLFNILGFRIKLDMSWFLIAALIVWSLSTAYFPHTVPGLSLTTYLSMAVIAMLGLFACLVLHELAHSLVARRFGLDVGGITLFIFGGVAELQEEPRSPGSEFWISIAGPAMSFALAALSWLAEAASLAAGAPGALTAIFGYLAFVNVILAVFNLIPAFPLDGGRVFRAMLWRTTGDVVRGTAIAARVSAGFAYALIAFGLISVFTGGGVGAFWMVLIGMFLLSAARSTYQQVLIRHAQSGQTVAALMTRAPLTIPPDATLEALAEEVMLRHGVSFVPVVGAGRLLGYVDTAALRARPRSDWAGTPVREVLVPASAENTLTPETPIRDVMQRLAGGRQRKFLVARQGQLVGVLSLSDLMAYIAVLQEIGLGDRRPRR